MRKKASKARLEAYAKKFISVFGWDVLQDERNWITKNEKEGHRYFSTLENALWYISEQMEKGIEAKNLKEVVNEIKRVKKEFLEAIATKIHRQGSI